MACKMEGDRNESCTHLNDSHMLDYNHLLMWQRKSWACLSCTHMAEKDKGLARGVPPPIIHLHRVQTSPHLPNLQFIWSAAQTKEARFCNNTNGSEAHQIYFERETSFRNSSPAVKQSPSCLPAQTKQNSDVKKARLMYQQISFKEPNKRRGNLTKVQKVTMLLWYEW